MLLFSLYIVYSEVEDGRGTLDLVLRFVVLLGVFGSLEVFC